eukprot:scaffold4729_cov273-Pinguiococcus_pyrenoidosus.AAC.2
MLQIRCEENVRQYRHEDDPLGHQSNPQNVRGVHQSPRHFLPQSISADVERKGRKHGDADASEHAEDQRRPSARLARGRSAQSFVAEDHRSSTRAKAVQSKEASASPDALAIRSPKAATPRRVQYELLEI